MPETIQPSPEKTGRFADLASKARYNFSEEMEPQFLAALKLKLPESETIPAIPPITLAKATKSLPNPHATRQLCELMEHFPQENGEAEGAEPGQIELDLEGTCGSLDTTVKFSPRGTSLALRKPVTEPIDVADKMVDHALQYVSSWRDLAAKVRDPKTLSEIQDPFLDMLSTAYLIREAHTLEAPQNDRTVLIDRFEKACQLLGINEPEAAFMNITSIFYQAEKEMKKVNLGGVHPGRKIFDACLGPGQAYTNPDEVIPYVKRMFITPWTGGDGTVYAPAAINAIVKYMGAADSREDQIGRLFRNLELVGADQEAVRNRLVLRALQATGGSDTALCYYFRRRYGDRFSEVGDQVVLRGSNFREIAKALEDYARAVGVPIDLDLRSRKLEGSGANLLEDIGYLKNAQEVILDRTQEIDFLAEIRKTLRGENNVPIMFVGRSGAGKTTLAAAFGEMIMAQKERGLEDMSLYVPRRKGGEGVMTAQEVEKAMIEFTIDTIYNSGDGKFRYLVIDDLHQIGMNPDQWKRIHQVLNLINPFLKDNPNGKIAIATEESPNTVALQAAQRIKKFNTNTLWEEGKPSAKVAQHMKLALRRKCKIADERASEITKLIMGIARDEVKKRGRAVPFDAITFGFVVADVGDNIAQETDLARIESYIRSKVSTRFEEIMQETKAKRKDEVAIALESFGVQLATLTASSETDHTALGQLQQTVEELLHRDGTREQNIQALLKQNAELTARIVENQRVLDEEKAARLVLEEKVSKTRGGVQPAETPSGTALPQAPPPTEEKTPRSDLVISTGRRRR